MISRITGRGTAPLGWALYLPEEWCEDAGRRRKAKIPEDVSFRTKPELGVGLAEQATGWEIPRAPILGDQAYGENTGLRDRLDEAGSEYVLAVGPTTTVFGPETSFEVLGRTGRKGRPQTKPKPDREPESIGDLIARLEPDRAQTVAFRDGPDGEPVSSRFLFVRVRAAHHWRRAAGKWKGGAQAPPREECLIAEWPEGAEEPTGYWLSNLPEDAGPERLARLARMRWKIELDYRQLKGELGLDHYEGRSYLGWHHHTALVTAAHGFLTLERLHPKARRPA